MRAMLLGLALVTLFIPPETVRPQPAPKAPPDRRDRRDPEFTLATGGRTGTCDVLAFTPDGSALLAAGDDRVVHAWDVTAKGLSDKPRVLRWPSWREERGGIKALAIDPTTHRIALGGKGIFTDFVAILDPTSRAVVAATSSKDRPPAQRERMYPVYALAFSPDGSHLAYGTGDGSVWLWDLRGLPTRIGRHARRKGQTDYDRVRLLAWRNDGVLSVAEDGQVVLFRTDGGEPRVLAEFFANTEPGTLREVAYHAESGRLVAISKTWRGGDSNQFVRLLTLSDGQRRDVAVFGALEFPRSVALDAAGARVAVGVGRAMPPQQTGNFLIEADDRLLVYDMDRQGEPLALPHTGPAEALAWSKQGRLAVAGGDRHEVRLWDVTKPEKPLTTAFGVGRNLWGVALSQDGKLLGWQDHRDPQAVNVNHRGGGPWRAFDLETRDWVEGGGFKPIEQLDHLTGWRVVPDPTNSYVWRVARGDQTFDLFPAKYAPIYQDSLEKPRCFTFVRGSADRPARLLVGYYHGFCAFDLTDDGPKLAMWTIGHYGEVMAIAASADGDWAVTASTDQTIAAWRLKPWPSQAVLGAKFAADDNKLTVKQVDVGSPAWEAGLNVGDEVVSFGSEFISDVRMYDVDKGQDGPEQLAAALRELKHPLPGRTLVFKLRGPGRKQAGEETTTTVRQRPTWKFFPAGERDWLLWIWKGSYYDTSDHGHDYAGWLVNTPSLRGKPGFYRAEQFRSVFRQPTALDKLIATHSLQEALKEATAGQKEPLGFSSIEPPAVSVQVMGEANTQTGAALTLSIAPRSPSIDHRPRRAELWVNDYRVEYWPGPNRQLEQFDQPLAYQLPAAYLRPGDNRVTLLTFNRVGGRGEAQAVVTFDAAHAARPRLLGLAVGVIKYDGTVQEVKAKAARGARGGFPNLSFTLNDAQQLRDALATQRGKLYESVNLAELPDQKATRADILRALDELARTAKPTDRVVIFLSGHGDFLTADGRSPERGEMGTFVFCCSGYQREHYKTTGLTAQKLYEKLAVIPGYKLLVMDACHSGGAAKGRLLLDLTPAGQGPTILASCDRNETSWEDEKYKHGLFAYALIEALTTHFHEASGGSNTLDPAHAIAYVRHRLPELLTSLGHKPDSQNPTCFPEPPQSFPIAIR